MMWKAKFFPHSEAWFKPLLVCNVVVLKTSLRTGNQRSWLEKVSFEKSLGDHRDQIHIFFSKVHFFLKSVIYIVPLLRKLL